MSGTGVSHGLWKAGAQAATDGQTDHLYPFRFDTNDQSCLVWLWMRFPLTRGQELPSRVRWEGCWSFKVSKSWLILLHHLNSRLLLFFLLAPSVVLYVLMESWQALRRLLSTRWWWVELIRGHIVSQKRLDVLSMALFLMEDSSCTEERRKLLSMKRCLESKFQAHLCLTESPCRLRWRQFTQTLDHSVPQWSWALGIT